VKALPVIAWTLLGTLLAFLLAGAAFYDRGGWPDVLPGEATALMQASSLAHDFDLRYERADFDRFLLAWKHDPRDLRHFAKNGVLHTQIHLHRLSQRDRRQLLELHDEIPLVHRRHESLADERVGNNGQCERAERTVDDPIAVRQRTLEQRPIKLTELARQPRLLVRSGTHQKRCEHRDHGERQQQRAAEREADGERHG